MNFDEDIKKGSNSQKNTFHFDSCDQNESQSKALLDPWQSFYKE